MDTFLDHKSFLDSKGKVHKRPVLYFKNKCYRYLYKSEELVIKTIIRVLTNSPRHTLGTTEIVKNVQHIMGKYYESIGQKRRVNQSTINSCLLMLLAIKNSKKVGSRECMKTWEISRKRYWKYFPPPVKKDVEKKDVESNES